MEVISPTKFSPKKIVPIKQKELLESLKNWVGFHPLFVANHDCTHCSHFPTKSPKKKHPPRPLRNEVLCLAMDFKRTESLPRRPTARFFEGTMIVVKVNLEFIAKVIF